MESGSFSTVDDIPALDKVVYLLSYGDEFKNNEMWSKLALASFDLIAPSLEQGKHKDKVFTPLARAGIFLKGKDMEKVFLGLIQIALNSKDDEACQRASSIANAFSPRVEQEAQKKAFESLKVIEKTGPVPRQLVELYHTLRNVY